MGRFLKKNSGNAEGTDGVGPWGGGAPSPEKIFDFGF